MNYFKLLLCLAALVSTTFAHGHGFFKSAPSHAYAYHPQHYSVGTAYLGKALFVSPPQPVFKAVPVIKTIAVAPPPPPPPTIIRTPVYIHLPPPPPPPPTIIRTPIFVHAAPLPLPPPPPPPPSAIIHSYSGPVAPILPPPTYIKTFVPHVPPPPPPPPPQFISYHQHTPVVKTVSPGWHHEAEHASFAPALQPHPVSVEANSVKFHSFGQPSSAYGPPSAPAW